MSRTSWEGFVIENLLAAAPERTSASFYRTAAGAEIDLLLEVPGHGLWAVEIKRSLSGRPEKGFYIACQDLRPERRFLVNAGKGHYPIDSETTAIGLRELAATLTSLADQDLSAARQRGADGAGRAACLMTPGVRRATSY